MSAARPVGPPKKDLRIPALRRFATAITVLNTLGHTILGFETSLLQLFVAVGTAYATEVVIELVSSWSDRRRPAFLGGGWVGLMDFMLPSHISGMALSMLLYGGDRLLPFAFASVIAITSKSLFVAPVNGRSRHFLNPSNTGIAVTLFLFPWIAVAPPYHFTENLFGGWDWVLPGVIICTGSILNTFFTRRMWLILAWVGSFVAQAGIRHLLFDTWLQASLAPMTGVAFLLFTFYMVTDPGTTPSTRRGQLIFGAFLGLAYGTFVALHIQFQLFFGLFVVCTARGLILHAVARGWVLGRRRVEATPVPAGEDKVSRPVAAV
jgi:hypothetical protein